jgi:hypothetical protein
MLEFRIPVTTVTTEFCVLSIQRIFVAELAHGPHAVFSKTDHRRGLAADVVEKSAFRFLMGEQPTLAFSNSSNHQATGFFLQEGTHGETHRNRSRCHLWWLWRRTPGDVIAGVRDQLPESQESDSD